MSARRGGDDDFLEAMSDVRPLEDDHRAGFRRRARRRGSPEPSSPSFRVEHRGVSFYGLRSDAAESLLEDLRQGRVEPANRLDLHGMTEEAARSEVFRFVRQSRASGLACVALVHGRGLRSPAGPVLKAAMPRWLTQLPLARDVQAFASAPPGMGGDGVTLVSLARGS